MKGSMKVRNLRRYIVIASFALSLVAVLWKYAALAFDKSPVNEAGGRVVKVRGSLYDREGRLLAVDTDLYDLSVWKPSLRQKTLPDDIEALSAVLQIPPADLLAAIDSSTADFAYIARRISGDTARLVSRLLDERGAGGISVERVPGRVYPERDLAAQLVGFVGTENIGLEGAEAAFESELRADPEKAKAGFAYGNDVFLTIDADLQFKLEQLCLASLEENQAEAVVMVAMQARTGKVLAYVSMPDFDPNKFLEADRSAWQDRVSIYTYEPGSVFKVYSMAALMALGGISESSVFVCDGSYERAMAFGEEVIIKCMGVHGRVNLTKILEYSCNAGAAYASDTVSNIDFYGKMRDFGFGDRPGADLAGESYGLFNPPDTWSPRSKPTIGFGQEILVSAMQMTSAATVLANGGVLLRARTLERIQANDGTVLDQSQTIAVKRVMEEREAKAVLLAMEAVTLDTGTGHRARIDDLRMSVKTGTAQMIDTKTKRYSPDDFIASTLTLFPSDAPEYIVYAAIIKPRGASIYGGKIAAPLVRDAALAIANLYGIARGSTPVAAHSGQISIPQSPVLSIGDVMPSFIGVPKRLLTPLLERSDITVDIQGDGWVVEQEPKPGESVSAGTLVILRLQ